MALSGRGWRRAAFVVVGLAATALAARVLFDSSGELLTAADTLTSVRARWVVAAVLVEVLSYLARGAASTVVLRCAGPRIGSGIRTVVTLTGATLAGDAAAYCLPFGFVASGVVMVGVLRRRKVGAALASWMFAVSSVFYVATLTVLTIISVEIPGADNPIPGLPTISAALLGALVLLGAGYALPRRPTIRTVIRRGLARALPRVRLRAGRHTSTLQAGRRTSTLQAGRRTSTLQAGLRVWADHLRTVRLTPAAGVAAFAFMTVSWLADVAVLALAFLALGSTPPWTGLLLAYCAGQIAASMPVTPGGLGVVEGSITLALVAFGGDKTITLAAVLLYRLIAYWGCLPTGGMAWLTLRATSRAPERQAVATRPKPVAAGFTKTGVAETERTS